MVKVRELLTYLCFFPIGWCNFWTYMFVTTHRILVFKQAAHHMVRDSMQLLRFPTTTKLLFTDPFPPPHQLTTPSPPSSASWQAILDDCLTHREEAVRGYAVAALPAFTRSYITTTPADVPAGPSHGGGDVTDGDGSSAGEGSGAGLLDRYLAEVDSDSQSNRRGFALAVGRLAVGAVGGRGGAVGLG